MVLELPEELVKALQVQADALGVSPESYVRELIERGSEPIAEAKMQGTQFKDSFGILAKYGPAPSAEEIDENRADMFRNFGEEF
jgi:plasmid stability protein